MSTAILTAPALAAPQLRNRLRSGVSWSLLGTVFSQGSVFGVNLIVAHALGQKALGEYAILQSTVVTWASMAGFGLDFTANKYLAEFRSNDRDRAGRILTLCAAASACLGSAAVLILLFCSDAMATYWFHAPNLALGLMLASLGVLFSLWNNFQRGALAGLEAYAAIGKAGVLGGLGAVALCSLASLAGSVNMLMLAVVTNLAAQAWVMGRLLWRAKNTHCIPIHWRGLWGERAIVGNFCLPLALSGFTMLPALWLANTFLLQRPDGYAQLAVYSAANNLRVLVLFLPGIVNGVVVSLLNNRKGAGDDSGYSTLFWTNAGLTAVATVVGVALAALFGPWLLRLFGKDFAAGYPVLLLLLLSTLPEMLLLCSFQMIQSQGKMWLSLFAIALPRDLTVVLLACCLTDCYGAVGLAVAAAGGQTVAVLTIAPAVYWLSRGGLVPLPGRALGEGEP